ncbi:MAG TPA: radical SAM protein [Planctomycetota bacterium]|nr:radical SAM protein [Planctomycetota bacterium]
MGFVANYLLNLGAAALGREPSRPLLFSYYVTHRCPWNCIYCSDGRGRPFREDRAAELSLEDAGRLLAILRRSGDTLDITGGEPLAREDLEAVLERARALGFRTVLNTRGIGLRRRPALLGLVDALVLSVDALDAPAVAALMGGDEAAAGELLETLAWAVAERRRLGFRLVLSVVATPDNLDGARRVLGFAAEHRLGFHLSPQILGIAPHPELRDNARYRALLEEVLAAKRRGTNVMGVAGYYRGARDFVRYRCHPLLMPTIRPDGRLYYPCLESGRAEAGILEAGDYRAALEAGRRSAGPVPDCGDRCQIFCHMALSLLQRRPLAALGEMSSWRN